MEERDLKIIEQYAETDPELKTLWEEHMLFERQLAKFEEKATSPPLKSRK